MADGKEFDLQVQKSQAIMGLKTMCKLETAFDESKIKLFIRGAEMNVDEKTIGEYQIEDGSEVILKHPSIKEADNKASNVEQVDDKEP